jgi:hypothetical protein
MLTLGAIWKAATELLLPGVCHFIRRKSDIPNQVSSRFRYTRFSLSVLRKASAHYCRSILLVVELAVLAMCLTFLKRIPRSFMTYLTSPSVIKGLFGLLGLCCRPWHNKGSMCRPWHRTNLLTSFSTYLHESINSSLETSSSITFWINSVFCCFTYWIERSSSINLGFLLVFDTRIRTVCLEILRSCATVVTNLF